jgi:hypothetical protein
MDVFNFGSGGRCAVVLSSIYAAIFLQIPLMLQPDLFGRQLLFLFAGLSVLYFSPPTATMRGMRIVLSYCVMATFFYAIMASYLIQSGALKLR